MSLAVNGGGSAAGSTTVSHVIRGANRAEKLAKAEELASSMEELGYEPVENAPQGTVFAGRLEDPKGNFYIYQNRKGIVTVTATGQGIADLEERL